MYNTYIVLSRNPTIPYKVVISLSLFPFPLHRPPPFEPPCHQAVNPTSFLNLVAFPPALFPGIINKITVPSARVIVHQLDVPETQKRK